MAPTRCPACSSRPKQTVPERLSGQACPESFPSKRNTGVTDERIRNRRGQPASLPRTAEAPHPPNRTSRRFSRFPACRRLMEHAAAKLMRPMLRNGESSIALSLNLTHAVTGPVSGNLRRRRDEARRQRARESVSSCTCSTSPAWWPAASTAARSCHGPPIRRSGATPCRQHSMLLSV